MSKAVVSTISNPPNKYTTQTLRVLFGLRGHEATIDVQCHDMSWASSLARNGFWLNKEEDAILLHPSDECLHYVPPGQVYLITVV